MVHLSVLVPDYPDIPPKCLDMKPSPGMEANCDFQSLMCSFHGLWVLWGIPKFDSILLHTGLKFIEYVCTVIIKYLFLYTIRNEDFRFHKLIIRYTFRRCKFGKQVYDDEQPFLERGSVTVSMKAATNNCHALSDSHSLHYRRLTPTGRFCQITLVAFWNKDPSVFDERCQNHMTIPSAQRSSLYGLNPYAILPERECRASLFWSGNDFAFSADWICVLLYRGKVTKKLAIPSLPNLTIAWCLSHSLAQALMIYPRYFNPFTQNLDFSPLTTTTNRKNCFWTGIPATQNRVNYRGCRYTSCAIFLSELLINFYLPACPERMSRFFFIL